MKIVKHWWLAMVAVAAAMLAAPVAVAADDAATVRAEIGKVYTAHLNAMKNKDLGGVIATLHPRSPAFNGAKASAAQTMVNFDLSYNITSFEVVGVTKDGQYAIVRAKLETRKVAGAAPFEDNELDALQAFAKDGNQWKIWGSIVLGVKPLK